MKLTVKGIRGADLAEIEMAVNRITLIAGENGAGKSSIIEAAQAVLGARPLPPGTHKDWAKAILHDGVSEGVVKFECERGTRKIEYPRAELHTLNGSGLLCNEWSLGWTHLNDCKVEERARQLIEITGCKIDEKRLKEELEKTGISGEKVAQLCVVTMKNGHEQATNLAETWAKDLKAQFKVSTGVVWGSNQGLTFEPPSWTNDLAAMTIEQLQKEVEDKRVALEEAIGKGAVAKSSTEHAGKKQFYTDEIMGITEKIDYYKNLIFNMRHAIASQEAIEGKCDFCGEHGYFLDGHLLRNLPLLDESVKNAKEDLPKFEQLLGNAQLQLGVMKSNLELAIEAEKRNADAPDVEAFRGAYFTATNRYAAKVAKDKGTHLHYQIDACLKAAEIVSPKGLAMQALLEAIQVFNKNLAKISEVAGWENVSINRTLELFYNQRHYRFISKSEQYRADAAVQIVISKMTKQEIVVMDEADILDGAGRQQLFNALKFSKLTSLVGMTVNRKKDGGFTVPDLSASDLGVTYVVNKGIARPLQQAVVA